MLHGQYTSDWPVYYYTPFHGESGRPATLVTRSPPTQEIFESLLCLQITLCIFSLRKNTSYENCSERSCDCKYFITLSD